MKSKFAKSRLFVATLSLIMVFTTLLPTTIAQASTQDPLGASNAASAQVSSTKSFEGQSAEEIVSQMTLKQKIGQMIIPNGRKFNGVNFTELNPQIKKALQDYGFGGFIFFQENLDSTAQTAGLTYDMQKAMMEDSSLTKIPLFTSTDQEGGNVYRLASGCSMPGSMATGATQNPAYANMTGQIISEELQAEGINTDFAPDMDVNNNPSNPVIGTRSFSDDPNEVSRFGPEFIAGLHLNHEVSAIKHFPGHGDTAVDSHSGLPLINKSYDEIKEMELIPFKAGINAGTDMIMTAHIQFPQIETHTYTSKETGKDIYLPATLSKTMITDILRGKMGYNGIVITDSCQMAAIAKNFGEMDTAKLAINAGVDILLGCVSLTSEKDIKHCGEYIQGVCDMVESGKIPESRIDESVTRIIQLKIDQEIINPETRSREEFINNALEIVGSEDNHALEMEIAKTGVTLVKNSNHTLPIQMKNDSKAVIFTPYSNEILSAQYAVNVLKEKGIMPENAECQVFCYQNRKAEEFTAVIQDYDYIIGASELSGSTSMDPEKGWQAAFLDDLINLTHSYNKQITIASYYLPYDLARFQKADALLACYDPIGMSEMPENGSNETKTYGPNIPAAIMLSFGIQQPTGKLPVNIMKLNDKYEYTDEILYPRGFGLTSWKEEYTVTFMNDDQVYDTQTVEEGDFATMPKAPTKDGYTFQGWFENSKDESFDFERTPITSNLTLTAKWQKNSPATPPINDNSGSQTNGLGSLTGDNMNLVAGIILIIAGALMIITFVLKKKSDKSKKEKK